MNTKETYERMILDVTLFGKEDVIATSGENPGGSGGSGGGSGSRTLNPQTYEVPIGF